MVGRCRTTAQSSWPARRRKDSTQRQRQPDVTAEWSTRCRYVHVISMIYPWYPYVVWPVSYWLRNERDEQEINQCSSIDLSGPDIEHSFVLAAGDWSCDRRIAVSHACRPTADGAVFLFRSAVGRRPRYTWRVNVDETETGTTGVVKWTGRSSRDSFYISRHTTRRPPEWATAETAAWRDKARLITVPPGRQSSRQDCAINLYQPTTNPFLFKSFLSVFKEYIWRVCPSVGRVIHHIGLFGTRRWARGRRKAVGRHHDEESHRAPARREALVFHIGLLSTNACNRDRTDCWRARDGPSVQRAGEGGGESALYRYTAGEIRDRSIRRDLECNHTNTF